MKVIVEMRVLVEADSPDGSVEVGPLRDAVNNGLHLANAEGYLTPLDNEAVTIIGWGVSHVSTKGG